MIYTVNSYRTKMVDKIEWQIADESTNSRFSGLYWYGSGNIGIDPLINGESTNYFIPHHPDPAMVPFSAVAGDKTQRYGERRPWA